MSNAVIPRWHGDNYQARFFWENVLNLLDSTSGVVEVSFEADGPKAFDDVVVKYDPPQPRSGIERASADYHQVKWHVETGGRFGYEDFIKPEFIGATTFSLLERLQQARRIAGPGSYFNFVTVYRVSDKNQLGKLISAVDHSLLIERLFDKTGDGSQMGKVRKLWREHLKLSSNEELKDVVKGLRIFEGHRSLDELRAQINLKARLVGLLTCSTTSDFRYDELARQLKVRNINVLTREVFQRFCQEEGLIAEKKPNEEDLFLKIAIRSFLGIAADIVGASVENTLLLTEHFNQRYLRDDRDWQKDILPKVRSFLHSAVAKSSRLRIILDAHASIAFLVGTILNFKSGTEVELVQKGRVGSRVWKADSEIDKLDASPLFTVSTDSVGKGNEIAVCINVTHNVEGHARRYTSTNLPHVGTIVSFDLSTGPSQQSIVGGSHATLLAQQAANTLRNLKATDSDIAIHIFAACPNALLFFLGQHSQGIAPCIIYEFDFDRLGNKSYQPSFVIK